LLTQVGKNDPAVLVALSDLKLALKNIYGKNLSIENSGGSLPANSIAILKKEIVLYLEALNQQLMVLKKKAMLSGLTVVILLSLVKIY